MKKKIDTIIEDLTEIDSSLGENSEKLRKSVELIEKLKPEVDIDPRFKSTLHKELKERIHEIEGEKRVSFWQTNFFRYAGGGAFAAVLVIALFIGFQTPYTKTGGTETTFALNSDKGNTAVTEGNLQNLPPLENSTELKSGVKGKDKGTTTVVVKNDITPKESEYNQQVGETKPKPEKNKAVSTNTQLAVNEKAEKEMDDISSAPVADQEEIMAEPMVAADMAVAAAPSMAMKKTSRMMSPNYGAQPEYNTESYAYIEENDFYTVTEKPLSTFSVDVDTASYANLRRYINNGSLPPADAVRIEEMINYFSYDYKAPEGKHPFSVTTELGSAPWNKDHKLLLVGLQGEKIKQKAKPKSNLVFLIDTSGSMSDENKIGLLKKSFSMLIDEMSNDDRISIVAYAGSAGVVLEPTKAAKKEKILDSLNNLQAGGSTAGGQGIKLAYTLAEKNLVKNGNNRIILATDGDFNIGQSSDGDLARLVEEKRNKGIFITVLGFGMGNYKDSKMEIIADKGNGNYFYIDTVFEANKVMVQDMDSMLYTIAKDVKIQVEFNPAYVKSYRLIGYENRTMAAKDFNDDKKDAGEIGAGHNVTALYEIVPADSGSGKSDELKYQKSEMKEGVALNGELAFIKLRYKKPDEKSSILFTTVVYNKVTENQHNLMYAASVAEFGMMLRNSQYKGDLTYDKIIKDGEKYKGKDEFGYRGEFLQLVRRARLLDKNKSE
jgi:Ca-activated chloride channel family protein